ncbi:hypothetical protein PR202_ga12297 [Eleusine coracana subsp. coracana]|uniref:Uncharacterized protein n=1 Tax=Eleusine coracana subsp. coracana TaxID=191504 RepID=A0AAV5CBW7_ELECO|nr:hypothetical protein PR202_ga12297 [Eleusine coracana subsp. coracana]
MDCRVDGESAGDSQAADLMARLADVLRRLASRCVCEAWHAMVDARRLLRAKLLPLWLGWHLHQLQQLLHLGALRSPLGVAPRRLRQARLLP